MKKILSVMLCIIMLLSASACGKKDNTDTDGASLKDIPIASAENETDTLTDDNADEADDKNRDTDNDSDRTAESDRSEIESNLRDARELIESGDYDDASMIINSLKTRTLTAEEKQELDELQKKMLRVSD